MEAAVSSSRDGDSLGVGKKKVCFTKRDNNITQGVGEEFYLSNKLQAHTLCLYPILSLSPTLCHLFSPYPASPTPALSKPSFRLTFQFSFMPTRTALHLVHKRLLFNELRKMCSIQNK